MKDVLLLAVSWAVILFVIYNDYIIDFSFPEFYWIYIIYFDLQN